MTSASKQASTREMGKISFDYLPASPLLNGWRLALANKPLTKAVVPADRLDGLSIQTEDAIDIDVERYQRGCNRVSFTAKLSEHSYVYAKVRLVSKDGRTVSREGWIACDIGEKPPRKVSSGEWVVHRRPEKDGWTTFDLFLPEEVSHTFGKDEDLNFSELLGFRLRGSVSISPITLSTENFTEQPIGIKRDSDDSIKRKAWSRGEKIALGTFLLAIPILLTVPEVRKALHLAPPAGMVVSPASGESDKPLTAQGATDVQELRKLDNVNRLADSESDKTFAEIPSGAFGFADGLELVSQPLDNVPILSDEIMYYFEIHKLGDGDASIVGYVGPETFEHLREGLSPSSRLTLYSVHWTDASSLVAIRLHRLKCSRDRTLVVGDKFPNKTEISALDCVVR